MATTWVRSYLGIAVMALVFGLTSYLISTVSGSKCTGPAVVSPLHEATVVEGGDGNAAGCIIATVYRCNLQNAKLCDELECVPGGATQNSGTTDMPPGSEGYVPTPICPHDANVNNAREVNPAAIPDVGEGESGKLEISEDGEDCCYIQYHCVTASCVLDALRGKYYCQTVIDDNDSGQLQGCRAVLSPSGGACPEVAPPPRRVPDMTVIHENSRE